MQNSYKDDKDLEEASLQIVVDSRAECREI